MAQFDPCVCCGGVYCCSPSGHPDLPASGAVVPTSNVPVEGADNVWTTVKSWTARSGRPFGVQSFNIVGAAGSCQALASVRLRFTDLCIDESKTDPVNCGSCNDTAESFHTMLSGSWVCENQSVVVPGLPGTSTFFWSCYYRKVELQVKLDFLCPDAGTNPGGYRKCSDGMTSYTFVGLKHTIPPGSPVGYTHTFGTYPLVLNPGCTCQLCTPYRVEWTVDIDGELPDLPLSQISNVTLYAQAVSWTPPGTQCVICNNCTRWYPWWSPFGPPALPVCTTPCSCLSTQACATTRMFFYRYNTPTYTYLCRNAWQCDPALTFPGTLTLGFFMLPWCCDTPVIVNWRLWLVVQNFPGP